VPVPRPPPLATFPAGPRIVLVDITRGGPDPADAKLRPRAGTRLFARSVTGFRITEAAYGPGGRVRRHTHDTAGLAIVLDGGYRKHMAGVEHQCGPGTVTIEPPGVAHGESYGRASTRAVLFEIDPSLLGRLLETASCLRVPGCLTDGAAGLMGRRAVQELRATDGASSLALEAMALELIALAERRSIRPRQAPAWLDRVRERLNEEFLRATPVAELAALAGVHPTHLARAFRAQEGCSLGEWVRRRRVAWAADQMATEAPLSTIAHAAGFADQSHFTRVFTRLMGLSPARFRAALPHRR